MPPRAARPRLGGATVQQVAEVDELHPHEAPERGREPHEYGEPAVVRKSDEEREKREHERDGEAAVTRGDGESVERRRPTAEQGAPQRPEQRAPARRRFRQRRALGVALAEVVPPRALQRVDRALLRRRLLLDHPLLLHLHLPLRGDVLGHLPRALERLEVQPVRLALLVARHRPARVHAHPFVGVRADRRAVHVRPRHGHGLHYASARSARASARALAEHLPRLRLSSQKTNTRAR